MTHIHWRPCATPALFQARAALNQQIRDFFRQRQVLEVETPLLSHTIGTDPNLHPVTALYQAHPHAPAATLYLQTSPEFAMKRLLASGSGAIFQLCKAFRNGEAGSRHNPEFTLLEWYQPGFTLARLMDEVEALVNLVLGARSYRRITYRDLFLDTFGIDPHTAATATLAQLASRHVDAKLEEASRDVWLDLLYSEVLEPTLRDAVFITDYPASQAALARITTDAHGQQVAQRFELVIQGMEIANGYDELVDAAEQQQRFVADNVRRRQLGLPEYAADERLLAALAHGLPPSAGVALGVDRLLMLHTGAKTIAEVLAFTHPYA
jgi:lysyl-tRNA synthetase class 2